MPLQTDSKLGFTGNGQNANSKLKGSLVPDTRNSTRKMKPNSLLATTNDPRKILEGNLWLKHFLGRKMGTSRTI